MGTYIGLACNGRMDFARPFEEAAYTWAELAVMLSRICRYNGAIPWSVGQHLLLCDDLARALPKLTRRYVRFHDVHEALVMDVPSPLKPFLGAPYADLEARAEADVHRRAGLSWPPPLDIAAEVARIDRLAFQHEVWILGQPVHREGVPQPRDIEGQRSLNEWRYERAEIVARTLQTLLETS